MLNHKSIKKFLVVCYYTHFAIFATLNLLNLFFLTFQGHLSLNANIFLVIIIIIIIVVVIIIIIIALS